MSISVLTIEDLQEFKTEFLQELKELFKNQSKVTEPKKWLRSQEVRDMLSISSGTLQNLRINGTIPYTKMGGVLYYSYDEITKVLVANRTHNKF